MLLSLGCEVRGVIGSNRSGGVLDGGVDDGAVDTGAMPSSDGAVTGGDGAGEGGQDAGGTTTNGDDGDDGDGADDAVFDVGTPDAPPVCQAPLPVVCDRDDDPWHALGVNCGGLDGTLSYSGDPRGMHVHEGMLGTSGVFSPREGERMLVLSTGDAHEMTRSQAALLLDDPDCEFKDCPSQQLGDGTAMLTLPAPLDYRRVSDDRDCGDDPLLIGEGDCSNSLESEFTAGQGAVDYAEIRMQATVPELTDGLAFQFAFFTAEYPTFAVDHASPWNDMYVAWLQSESWTGNVSFDNAGNPVSINSVFLDYRDEPPGTAPELAGFAAESHAATDWLQTIAPVTPGETIELVIAVMDLTDGLVDTAIALDGFEWTCTDLPPKTAPAG